MKLAQNLQGLSSKIVRFVVYKKLSEIDEEQVIEWIVETGELDNI